VIVSLLNLPVREGCENEVVRFYAEHDVFGLAERVAGCRSGRLLQPVDHGAPFLVVAEWDDAAAYDRWLAAPARAELGELLGPLLDGDPSGSVYSTAGSDGARTRPAESEK
jgi:heme-degrading monooxygenase HmoA